jgi:hypothetical protein
LPSTASAGISTSVSFDTLMFVPACVSPMVPSSPVTIRAGSNTVDSGSTDADWPAIVTVTSPPTAVTEILESCGPRGKLDAAGACAAMHEISSADNQRAVFVCVRMSDTPCRQRATE